MPGSFRTASEQAEEVHRLRSQQAMMQYRTTPGGSQVVNCPYCIIEGIATEVDISKWIDAAGKREVKVICKRGHTLKFRTLEQWQEERQRAGIQRRS
jgi:hypothetical protein